MAFREFRFHPEAEKHLVTLFTRGPATFVELKRQIRVVMDEWEPQDLDHPQFVLSFEGFYLMFTVSAEDESILILAGLEPQPRE